MRKQWLGVITFALMASPCLLEQRLLAQQLVPEPFPPPASILGPQLIAWSQLQKPQPVAQPTPNLEASAAQQPSIPAQPQDSPSIQTVSGVVVRDDNEYVLKTPDNITYRIEQQDMAGLYENRQVKIVGSIDAKTKTLHITNIET
jgi:hypothetical protein